MDLRPSQVAKTYGSGTDWASLSLYVVCGLVAFYLILPILVVFPMSFSSAEFLTFPPPGFSLKWFLRYFGDPSWIGPTIVSLQVAAMAMILSTVLGTLAAMALVRARIAGRAIIHTFILFPMIIPVIIISIALYSFFTKIGLRGTRIGLVVGHSLLCIPFVVLTVSASLKGFDETLEKAAMICGASRLKTFARITFPMIRPGLISGALFAFIVSFDEIVISMFICGIDTKTLPLKMWEGIRMEINPVIPAVSTLLICFSMVLLVSVEILRRRLQSRIARA
ncbi:MAG: ABC transporter permease [Deltaproteobacteria bacterium]|nr:ABC transporter permease [Deltaproteobacteria bacterium]MBW2120301.1 ABC transporter permease [Deltaproteobacteria bacterium]